MATSLTDAVQATTETREAGEFAALLNKEFRPRSERAREEVESAVRTLAGQVLERAEMVSDATSARRSLPTSPRSTASSPSRSTW